MTRGKCTIRLVSRPGDPTIALLDRLDSAIFPQDDPYPKPGAYWWLARWSEKIAGFAGLKLVDGGDAGFLCRAGVLPKFQRRGIHQRMIEIRKRAARRLGLRALITYTRHNIPSDNGLIRAGFLRYEPELAWAGRGPEIEYWICKL